MYQVLKYTSYTLIGSSNDLHILSLQESGVTLVSTTQSERMLLVELSMQGSPVLMVVGSKMSKTDIMTIIDKNTIPVLITGTYTFNVRSNPALQWLDSLICLTPQLIRYVIRKIRPLKKVFLHVMSVCMVSESIVYVIIRAVQPIYGHVSVL